VYRAFVPFLFLLGVSLALIAPRHASAREEPVRAPSVSPAQAPKRLRHYVFFDRDRERIKEQSFLTNAAIEGAQLKYTWRELEPEKDRYRFEALRGDLAFLSARHKRLFVQLQDTSFDDRVVNVPEYLRREAEFNGGANRQYNTDNGSEDRAVPAGWVARRWDPAVQKRFHKLLQVLGREFDGRIAGLNLPETSIDFGESGRLYPPGFTPERYAIVL
jgi:hypothetical protein